MTSEQHVFPNTVSGSEILSRRELRIVLFCILVATVWMICSDMVLDWLNNDPIDSVLLQVYKSLKFVATTAALLVLVLRLYSNRLHLTEEQLRKGEQPMGLTTRKESSSIHVACGKTILPLSELTIGLLFLLLAGVWMVSSDMVLDWLNHDPLDTLPLQTEKGLNFLVTAVGLLLIALRRSLQRWRGAERRFRESEERFQLAGRAASDVIWDWTTETNTVWWSDSFSRLFGYTREEVQPTIEAWLARIHPEDKAGRVAAIEAVLRSERQTWAGEYRFRRKDGSYAFVQDRACVIRDAAGRAVRVVGGMTDITAQKEAEEKLERSRQQLRSLSVRIESLREKERTRIAREIHDELGQALSALKMDLRWVEKRLAIESNLTLNPILDKIVEAGDLVDSTISWVQRIASELRPRVLDDLGLTAALRQEARRFQQRTGVLCTVHLPESIPTPPPEVAMGVFRIFQETLTNVARHAECTAVEIGLACGPDGLVLRVADNGKGIQASCLDDVKSLGIVGMKERAESLGGEVTFHPGSPSGTVVELALPLTSHDTLTIPNAA